MKHFRDAFSLDFSSAPRHNVGFVQSTYERGEAGGRVTCPSQWWWGLFLSFWGDRKNYQWLIRERPLRASVSQAHNSTHRHSPETDRL